MTEPAKQSEIGRIGPESPSLLHFDRQMAIGFGALVLVMMVVVCMAGIFTYRRVAMSYEKQLTTALAGVLGDSINRTSFSGRYHVRLLLEEITAKHPKLAYILVVDSDHTIIAHSDPALNDTMLPDRLREVVDQVSPDSPTVLNRNDTTDGVIQEIIMPYETGFENRTAGVIITGISLESLGKQITAARFILAILIITLTIISLIATYFMSRYLATPVRQLASMLQGILDHAPILIGICRNDGTLVESSSSSLPMLSENIESNRWPLLTTQKDLTLAPDKIYSNESWFQLNGEDRVAAVTTFPIANNAGSDSELLCSIGMDVTELRNAEETVRLHRDELERQVYRRTRDLEEAYETIRTREHELIHMSQLRESLLGNTPFEQKFHQIADTTARLTHHEFVGIWAMASPAGTMRTHDLGESNTETNTLEDAAHRELALVALCCRSQEIDLSQIQQLDLGSIGVGRVATGADPSVVREQLTLDDDGRWAMEQGFTSFAGYRLCDTEGDLAGVLAVYGRSPVTRQQEAVLEDMSTTTAYVIQAQRAAFELARASRNLIRQERLATLGKLTATVSHELRNPLGTVGASFFSISQQLAPIDDPKLQRALERGTRSIERCDRIIEELLRFTRDATLHTEPTRIDQWVEEELATYCFPENIQIEADLNEPIEVILDRQAVYQCFINLLNNACDAVAEMAEDQRRIQVSLRRVDDDIHLIVEDSGPGIDPKDRQKVFEPLYSTKGFGTGLGLPLVQKLIGLHGGRLTLESGTHGGTRAILVLPRIAASFQKTNSAHPPESLP